MRRLRGTPTRMRTASNPASVTRGRGRSEGHLMSCSPVSGSPLTDSPDAAARVLCDYFLANADRGDNAANDEFVAELIHRIRTQQASSDGGRRCRRHYRTARHRPGSINYTDTASGHDTATIGSDRDLAGRQAPRPRIGRLGVGQARRTGEIGSPPRRHRCAAVRPDPPPATLP
jgi:hypothetical protein